MSQFEGGPAFDRNDYSDESLKALLQNLKINQALEKAINDKTIAELVNIDSAYALVRSQSGLSNNELEIISHLTFIADELAKDKPNLTLLERRRQELMTVADSLRKTV